MLDLDGLAVSASAKQSLARLARHPAHAVVLEGPPGIGKSLLARRLTASWLALDWRKADENQYIRLIGPEKNSISIDQIRSLRSFVQLKESRSGEIKRVIVLTDAEAMTQPAQNALLKLLEEPPEGTILLLTCSNSRALLPTILSRVQLVHLPAPSPDEVQGALPGQAAAELEQLYALSDGNIAEISRLLSGDESGPTALELAKRVLRADRFERLCMIDNELKDKTVAHEMLRTISRLASAALAKSSGDPAKVAQWHRVLRASTVADEAMAQNTSTKLVLTELMLSL